MSDVKTVYDAIKAKQVRYDALNDYYAGNQPTVYLTKRLREIFRNLDLSFTENWCAVVIDATYERINLTGLESTDKGAANALKAAWERNQLNIESKDLHRDAGVMGEGCMIAWPDEAGHAEIYWNDMRAVQVVYDGTNPRKIAFAGKVFDGTDGHARMTLYYPDRLEYYIAAKSLSEFSTAAAFHPDLTVKGATDGIAPNPYGKVPVFHFRLNRKVQSDLMNVIPLQNGINKLLSDMVVVAEYAAFPQRYIISQSDTSELKNAPSEIWQIPAGDGVGQQTQAGQFQAADLSGYLDAIDNLSAKIGVITRTPKHYLFAQGGDPSGEALIALEAPLNKKAQDRIDRFTPVWRDLGAFICQIENISVDPASITAKFDKPESIQPLTEAQITKTRTDGGVPLVTALRWEGKTDAEIEQMTKDQDEASQKSQASLGAALLEAERKAAQAPAAPVQQQGQTMPMNGKGMMPNNA